MLRVRQTPTAAETAEQANEDEAVAKASDAAVQGALSSALHNLTQHPFGTFGKVAEDAATDAFQESYIHERVGLALNHTAKLRGEEPTAVEYETDFTPGDLPIPPALTAAGLSILTASCCCEANHCCCCMMYQSQSGGHGEAH